MNSRLCIWSSILIVSLTGLGLCARLLALEMIPVGESLIVRGGGCLLMVMAFAFRRRLPLVPKSIGTQAFRALLAGLALASLTLSYNWLSASAVSVLSNIDVPLLIVLGPLVGTAVSSRARVLALLSVFFLVWYISGLETQAQLALGLSSLMIGSLLLCFGYLYIKKSMNEENEAVAILTPCLAIIVYGLAERVGTGSMQIAVAWTMPLVSIGLLSGGAMFAAYVATMRLYEMTDIASAEFPTLLSSLLIQPLEAFVLGESIKFVYAISSLGFVLTSYLILKMQRPIGSPDAA